MAMAGRTNLHWIASLKEQRRIGGLSGSEFWSVKPIWVLWFLLQLKADLCVWRNREESDVLGFRVFASFFFFWVSFVPWINGCLFLYSTAFRSFLFSFFFNDKRVLSERVSLKTQRTGFLNLHFIRVSFLDSFFT